MLKQMGEDRRPVKDQGGTIKKEAKKKEIHDFPRPRDGIGYFGLLTFPLS